MPGVLRVPRLQRLLGADVHGDGDNRQDADVPEGQDGSGAQKKKKTERDLDSELYWQHVLGSQTFRWPDGGSLEAGGLILVQTKDDREAKNDTQKYSCKQR